MNQYILDGRTFSPFSIRLIVCCETFIFSPNLPASIPVQYATLSPCSLALHTSPYRFSPLYPILLIVLSEYRICLYSYLGYIISLMKSMIKSIIYCVFFKTGSILLAMKKEEKCRRRKYPPTAYEKSVKTSRSCAKT